jgi:hypothetical protein
MPQSIVRWKFYPNGDSQYSENYFRPTCLHRYIRPRLLHCWQASLVAVCRMNVVAREVSVQIAHKDVCLALDTAVGASMPEFYLLRSR